MLATASAFAQVEYDIGSQRSEDRDHEWRFYLGGVMSLSGGVDETFRAFYAATGQDYKQSLAESYDLKDFGISCPYLTWGIEYERTWKWWTFNWDMLILNIDASAKAKRDYYLGVGDDIGYNGKSYDHLMIKNGSDFSVELTGLMTEFLFSFTPFTFFYGEEGRSRLTPSLDLGLMIFGGRLDIDAGNPTGTTVYQNPPVDFVIGGNSSTTAFAGAPKIGLGADFTIGTEDELQWLFHADLGYFTFDGSTKALTGASHRAKDIDVSYFSLAGEAGILVPLENGKAFTCGARLQFISLDGEIKSQEKDSAAIIAARERFDKAIDLAITTFMFYIGFNY